MNDNLPAITVELEMKNKFTRPHFTTISHFPGVGLVRRSWTGTWEGTDENLAIQVVREFLTWLKSKVEIL